jgi:hypothetical protein
MKTRAYIVILGLMLAGMSVAAPRYSQTNLSHWLGLSVTGVEANVIAPKSEMALRAGGGAQAHFIYELQAGGFFFNIGTGADFMVTNTAMNTHSEAFNRVDYTGEEVLYRYCYTNYREQQRQVRIVIPVQFGYQFGDWVYAGLGASFRTIPLLNSVNAHTRMFTEGEYDMFIEPIRNAPDYGYWPEAEYTESGKMQSVQNEVAVEAEAGVNVPIAVKWFRMRAGVYFGYDLPVGTYKKRAETPLADYSKVDTNPFTQSQENLRANLRFNSMLDTPVAKHDVQRMRIGLRLTILFDVTTHANHCMCMPDYTNW